MIALALAALAYPLSASAAPKAPKPSRHFSKPPVVKPGHESSRVDESKLDSFLKARKTANANSKETVDVIVTLEKGQDLPAGYRKYITRYFLSINAYEVDKLPVTLLATLEKEASVHRAHYNHSAGSTDVLSNEAVMADIQTAALGYDGTGVKVAFIDSGFAAGGHPDLVKSRVQFMDFTGTAKTMSDADGHGTHVAGVVAGTGFLDSKEVGIAKGASVVSLKVLDANGNGSIGDIIAAMDYVYRYGKAAGIKVVNLSVGAGVFESYMTDPLTLAAKALTDNGIVVVAAAGNLGKNAAGQLQYGGITSPGIAPWVITTCALSTNGTVQTTDDAVASFSSAGPTWIDFAAKPDVCAPGVGIVSLAAPGSTLVTSNPGWLIPATNGKTNNGAVPYLSLAGTSMATPFVSGTVALMLQANPNLTPNLVKAILEYTATPQTGVSPLRQGAGFMNTYAAVKLAKFYAKAKKGTKVHIDPTWSRHIIWGNHKLGGGIIDPGANAWKLGVEWGWAHVSDDDGDNIVWGTDDSDNIVWGTDCGGGDCDNIVWGTDDGDNIVWGTADDGDNIIWGTDDGDNIVWGTDDGDNIVWGTSAKDNAVWAFYKKGGK
ncbi:MAG TPA: S8 family serine peptidase [Vicinamibacterales bacterium]|nr:S8 family serine peptidase [Vicinamibacterales bacterium]